MVRGWSADRRGGSRWGGCLPWALILAVSRISSVSSLSATAAAPVLAWLMGFKAIVPIMLAIAAVVFFQHRGNIARLRAGTEPKVGQKG